MSRLILNGPERRGPNGGAPAGVDAGQDLARAMLRAVGTHTNDTGRVDYAALRASAEFAAAEASAARLARVAPERLTRPERLAFWINVYNALALHGVVALGLRRSVWQVWNFFGRVSYRVGPHAFSLDEIEHGLLRAGRRRWLPPWPALGRRDPRRALAVDPLDPRIHFALNCASASCPPIGVYRAAAVDTQLDLATRSFVNQEVRLDDRGRVSCSRIFKWYGRDFGPPEALAEFLGRHLDDGPVKTALAVGAPPCRVYRAYSWALPHPPA